MNTLNHLRVVTFQKSTGAKTNTHRHSKRPAVFALVLTLGLLVGATHGYAANLTWTNGSGDFFTAEKWDPAQTPVSGDTTFFTNNSSYTVSFAGSATDYTTSTFSNGVVTLDMGTSTWAITNQLRVGRGPDSTGTVYVAGGTLTIANNDPGTGTAQLRIGDATTGAASAAGTMFVTNGTVITEAINIGASSNAVGKLVVTGSGVLTNAQFGGTLTLGNGSFMPNQVIITNGGKVFILGEVRIGGTGTSNNLVLVSGPTSILSLSGLQGGVRVGAGATRGNMLIVSNGAKLFTGNGGTIGGNGGGTSFNTGIVVGAGSAWLPGAGGTNANIVIGTNGGGNSNNTLIVYDGGLLINDGTLHFGNAAPSLSNTFNMGGVGAMSTGFCGYLRIPGASTFSLANFSNAFFTTQRVSAEGTASNNTITVSRNATLVVTNSMNGLFANTGDATNNLTLNTGRLNTLLIDGGTLSDVSGSNVFGMVIGSGNQLIVTNGGKLLTELGTIGGGSAYGTAIVTGVSSIWSNAGPSVGARTNVIIVGTGTGGNSNYLTVVNGASLFNSGSLLIGNSLSGTVNKVVFGGPGAGSIVDIQGVTFVGHNSSRTNTLTINNATVSYGTIHVGTDTEASPNYTFTTNNITLGLVETNFCTSTNGLVATILTNCTPTITPAAVDNTMTLTSGTLTGGLVRVHGTNTFVYTSGTLLFTTLQVDGNMLGAALLNVPSGSTLSGVGSVANSVTIDGTLEPGDSAGTLTINNLLTLNAGATLDYELGTSSDQTVVASTLTLDGTLNVTDSGGFGVGNYTLITYGGTLVNNGLNIGTTPGGFSYAIVAGGGTVVLQVTAGGGDPFTSWQTFYFGCTGCSQAAGGADPDGDGMINTNEFLAGFNPTSSAAYLHVISVVRTANNITVTYLGANGDSTYTGGPASRTNVLEFTTGTANGSYSNNFASTGQTNILSGGTGLGTTNSFVDINGATGATRYYRVRVLVP